MTVVHFLFNFINTIHHEIEFHFFYISESWTYTKYGRQGCFPLCQRFRKFRLEFKWKGPFRILPSGIFGITSGGGPLISVGIFRSKFAVPRTGGSLGCAPICDAGGREFETPTGPTLRVLK